MRSGQFPKDGGSVDPSDLSAFVGEAGEAYWKFINRNTIRVRADLRGLHGAGYHHHRP